MLQLHPKHTTQRPHRPLHRRQLEIRQPRLPRVVHAVLLIKAPIHLQRRQAPSQPDRLNDLLHPNPRLLMRLPLGGVPQLSRNPLLQTIKMEPQIKMGVTSPLLHRTDLPVLARVRRVRPMAAIQPGRLPGRPDQLKYLQPVGLVLGTAPTRLRPALPVLPVILPQDPNHSVSPPSQTSTGPHSSPNSGQRGPAWQGRDRAPDPPPPAVHQKPQGQGNRGCRSDRSGRDSCAPQQSTKHENGRSPGPPAPTSPWQTDSGSRGSHFPSASPFSFSSSSATFISARATRPNMDQVAGII